MLNEKEAQHYIQQLHPAFAGYLHDGDITERNVLATVFELLLNGTLEPIWQEKSMLKALIGIKWSGKIPNHQFEKIIVKSMFANKQELSTIETGNIIKTGLIQNIIRDNLEAISTFAISDPILIFGKNESKKHNLIPFGSNEYKISQYNKMKSWSYVTILLVGLLILNLFLGRANLMNTLSITVSTAIALYAVFSILTVKKKVSYKYQRDVIPMTQKRYTELYEFIKSRPLEKHRFTNPFLPFSIAFGIDDSWHKDFGLAKEVKYDETPIVGSYN